MTVSMRLPEDLIKEGRGWFERCLRENAPSCVLGLTGSPPGSQVCDPHHLDKLALPGVNSFLAKAFGHVGFQHLWCTVVVGYEPGAEEAVCGDLLGPLVVIDVGQSGDLWVGDAPTPIAAGGCVVILDHGFARSCAVWERRRHQCICAFRGTAWFGMGCKTRARLKSVGFGIDNPKAWIPPIRTELKKDMLSLPGVVYVGRGAAHLNLPGSKWGNPFKIQGDVDRDRAVNLYRDYLASSEELKADIVELEGMFIVFHCIPL